MLSFLLLNAVWTAALAGIGSLPGLRRMLTSGNDPLRLPIRIVAGLVTLAAFAATWNLFAPLTPWLSVVALIAGLAAFAASRGEPLAGLDRSDAAAALALLALFSVVGGTPVTLFDSGLYHLQLLRWFAEGPLPLGLANLHERFGVDSLWFPLAPAMTLPGFPLSGASLVSLQLAFAAAFAGWKGARAACGPDPRPWHLLLAAVPLLLGRAFAVRTLPSPSPDLAVMLLTLLVLALLSRSFEESVPSSSLRTAALLALSAATVKLSAVPLAAGAFAVLAFRGRLPAVRRFVLPAALLIVLWTARGVVLTGHVVYPVPSTRLSAADWAVPTSLANRHIRVIRSHAMTSGQPLSASTPGSPKVIPWLRRNFSVLSWPPPPPALYGVLFLSSIPLLAHRRKRGEPQGAVLVPWIVSAGGLAFWFLSAPDPRFAEGLLYAFALLPLSEGILRSQWAGWPGRRRAASFTLALALVLAPIVVVETAALRRSPPFRPALVSPPPPPASAIVVRRTSSGLAVLVPSGDDRCWDAPTPCTPFFRADLSAETDPSGRIRKLKLPDSLPAAEN